MSLLRLLILGFAALAAACATPPARAPLSLVAKDQLRQFQIEARFSLRHQADNYSGRLSWNHGPQGDDILLMNPFGQGVARIMRQPGLARLLTADQKQFVAEDADLLVADVLGYPLPVSGMAEWLLARAIPGSEVRRDEAGRLLQLREAGWEIDYDYGDALEADALPLRLVARRGGDLELKLRIDDWNAQ